VKQEEKRRAAVFIPTLYFAEGLPYTIVNMMSVVFFKNLKLSNELIGLTSFLYLPWTIKAFWAPFIDLLGTKRGWIIGCQTALAVVAALLALFGTSQGTVALAVSLMMVIAIISATQDIAIDGFYMDALAKDQQAFYVGIRNAAYKVAWLLGSGGLVYLAGVVGAAHGINVGWSAAFGVCALLFVATAILHAWYLPRPVTTDVSSDQGLKFSTFLKVFRTYFQQPGIVAIVIYILTFRLGDAFMLKMAQPFLLDPPARGGLGMSTADVGLIYGTVGMIFLLIGGIVGGWLISRDGLRKWLWPTALIQNSAIILYWYLAVHKPNIYTVAAVNSAEQFSYGLGVAAYTVYLLSTVKPEYKAAHYAIATALMALGVMLPGAYSGFLQQSLGYANFFLVSFLAAIPGIIAIFFLPIKDVIPEKPIAKAVSSVQ
jgi:MFS transporter, PAT family, beta-lactamase induction signal transducer AmpG